MLELWEEGAHSSEVLESSKATGSGKLQTGMGLPGCMCKGPRTARSYTVKKKGPRGVRFEGCYSPGSVMAAHKGVELTSWGCWQVR